MRKIISCLAVLAVFGLAMPALTSSAMAAEEVSPEHIQGATTIDPAKAKELFDEGVLFIDSRSDSDWDAGRIPGAVHLDVKSDAFSEENILSEVDGKSDPIVFYCNGIKCLRSTMATNKAIEMGFTNLFFYRTGFPSWKNAGYPVE